MRDRQGNAKGLKRKDFEVRETGVRRTVLTFSFRRSRDRRQADRPAALLAGWKSRCAADGHQLRGCGQPMKSRTRGTTVIVLLFDTSSMQTEDGSVRSFGEQIRVRTNESAD